MEEQAKYEIGNQIIAILSIPTSDIGIGYLGYHKNSSYFYFSKLPLASFLNSAYISPLQWPGFLPMASLDLIKQVYLLFIQH